MSLFILALTSFQDIKKQKTILVIVAHPDDEAAMGGVLVKNARQGNKVIVMIATDGKDGFGVTNIPAGDSLGNLRKLESICATQKMGLAPPIFLSIDKLDTRSGVRNYMNGYKKLLETMRDHIRTTIPDAILTFGPDGDDHHAEHIVIGSAITELLLREGWAEKYPLYYLGFHSYPGEGYEMGHVDKQYFNVAINYSDEDEKKALNANFCYKTQHTQEKMQIKYEEGIADKENRSYFRRFVVKKGVQKDF